MKKRIIDYQQKYSSLISEHYEISHSCIFPQQEEFVKKRGRRTNYNNNGLNGVICIKNHKKLIDQAFKAYQNVLNNCVERNKENITISKASVFEFSPNSSVYDFSVIDELSHGVLSPIQINPSIVTTPAQTPLPIRKDIELQQINLFKSIEKSQHSEFIFESPSLMLNLEEPLKFVRSFHI